MKIMIAVFSGSVVAASFALLAGWLLASLGVPTLHSALSGAAEIPLLLTAVALIVGAVIATKIHPSAETLSGYATVQLFFGQAMIRDFWLGGAPWYSVIALVIVLPLTLLGGLLGCRQWLGKLSVLRVKRPLIRRGNADARTRWA
jgi:hypothetical protein